MCIRKVLFISKLSLVLVLGYVVVRTVLLPGHIDKNLAPAPAADMDGSRISETTGLPSLSSADYVQIVARNPFSLSEKSMGPGEWALTANSIDGKELGLTLFGTISGSPTVARAIIKDIKTGVLDLYKVGQMVGGARIKTIERDAVILAHNGKRKILRLNIAQSASYSDNTQRPSYQTNNAVATGLSTKNTTAKMQTKISPVEAILEKAVIKPYSVDGQVEGLKITGLENVNIAKYFGLKNGDVIRVVNGHRLTSKQKAFQVFKKARAQEAISFELLRDDKTKTLSFDLR